MLDVWQEIRGSTIWMKTVKHFMLSPVCPNWTSSIPSFNFNFFICSFTSSSIHLFSWPVLIGSCQNVWKLCISPSHSSISVITLIRSKGFCLFLCSFVSHKPFIRFGQNLGKWGVSLPCCSFISYNAKTNAEIYLLLRIENLHFQPVKLLTALLWHASDKKMLIMFVRVFSNQV